MNGEFNRAKSFGEVLDHTFQLFKKHFSKLFLIYLIILGPVYLLQALVLLGSGTSLIRHTGPGSNPMERILSGLDTAAILDTGLILNSLLGLVVAILSPVAVAAVLFAVQSIKNNVAFTPVETIKKAFTRFWALLGSGLIIGLIAVGIGIVVILGIGIFGVMASMGEPLLAFISAVILFLGLGLGIALLFTRWGFYLAAVVFREGFPGLAESWRLTKGYMWRTLGLFIVIFLIIGIITTVIETVLVFILGGSVLYSILLDLTTIFTAVISATAYAVIYFDLKHRKDGDDLHEMIDEYQNT